MTDQPKPEKPSALPPTAEPKAAEKTATPQSATSPSTMPDPASLPVTEKMPPPPGEATAKPPVPVLPRVDTKPVVRPPDVAVPDKLDGVVPPSSAASTPAASPETKPSADETVSKVTTAPLPEPKPAAAASPVAKANGEPQPAVVKADTAPATPESPAAASQAPTKPAAEVIAAPEKPVSPPPAPDAPKPVAADKPTAKIPEPTKDDTLPPGSSQRVTQRFTEPGAAAAPSAGTICPSCGHRNRPGTLICDNCGTNLIAGVRGAIGTRDLESAQETAKQDQPILSDTQVAAVKSAGSTEFSEDMVLRIEIEGGATPMLVYPKSEIIMGRRDPNTGTLPDVDLTAYAGYRMGVSRTHASIRLQDKVLNLSDRGSSNGTFLNGNKLTAHHPYPLRDGDEIRLGQMMLKIYFQTNKGRK